jgi:ankyrin repeat protein
MTNEEMNQEWLLMLIKENNIEEINNLIENNNFNLNFYHPLKIENPLVLAIKQNSLEIFNLLISKGADAHILISDNQYNLLTYLPFFSHDIDTKFLDRLIELGLKPYQDDLKEKNSALTFSLVRGNINLAQKFLKIGSDINEVDKEDTPIIYKVIERRLLSTLEFILTLKPNLQFIDNNHNSLIEYALQKGECEMAKKLFDNGALMKKINLKKIDKKYIDNYTEFQAYVEKQTLEKSIEVSHNVKLKQKI